MSRKWMLRLRLMTYGAITFGWFQAAGDLNWGTALATILGGFLDRLVNFLLGGNSSTFSAVSGNTSSSLLSSLFGA